MQEATTRYHGFCKLYHMPTRSLPFTIFYVFPQSIFVSIDLQSYESVKPIYAYINHEKYTGDQLYLPALLNLQSLHNISTCCRTEKHGSQDATPPCCTFFFCPFSYFLSCIDLPMVPLYLMQAPSNAFQIPTAPPNLLDVLPIMFFTTCGAYRDAT